MGKVYRFRTNWGHNWGHYPLETQNGAAIHMVRPASFLGLLLPLALHRHGSSG
jgi:hypothetical protein